MCGGTYGVTERPPYATAELELAIWFHDIIQTKNHDGDEAVSAEKLWEMLQDSGIEQGKLRACYWLIRVTDHRTKPINLSEALILDIDLAILGAHKEEFDTYEKRIREEYSWADEDVFKSARRHVLEQFLARDKIYRTKLFAHLEAQARENLKRSIGKLTN